MEVKMNKEIRNYQESMFMGLNLRQCIFSLLAIAVAVGIYLPVAWHECGAVCLGVYQVRIFIPQAIAVSKRGSVPCLHGRNYESWRKDQGRWCCSFEKAGTAGKEKTDEAEKEGRKEWCV